MNKEIRKLSKKFAKAKIKQLEAEHAQNEAERKYNEALISAKNAEEELSIAISNALYNRGAVKENQ